MISPIQIFLFCPIPEDQKPSSEYLEAKKNWVGNFVFDRISKSFQKVLFLFVFISFLLAFCLINNKYLFFDFFFFPFIFFVFFLGSFLFLWKQVQGRFLQSRLVYEEGSWYDTQMWEKPVFLLKKDRLLATQKLQPLIQKLFSNFLFLVFINIVFLSIFLLQ
jgi:hypothetical protein